MGNLSIFEGTILSLVVLVLLKQIMDLVKEVRANKKDDNSGGSTTRDIKELQKSYQHDLSELKKELISGLTDMKAELKAEILRVRDFYHEVNNIVNGLVQKAAVNEWRIQELEKKVNKEK